MRVLGVDFGRKRIGIAVGESGAEVASPRPTLAASGSLEKDARAIADLARNEEASLVVVGVPGEYEGDDRQDRVCRILAEEIAKLGLQIALVDESLTSIEAQIEMRGAGVKAAGRRRRVDSEAACRILERHFQVNRS